MEDSQESTISISGKESKTENSLIGDESIHQHQFLVNEFERELQSLERDIRQQKESSMNAKTAITFEQLRKIHNISRLLGPQKETFFDRICRAAEIQRASLKNRLKQNKDRFEPVNCLSTPTLPLSTPIFDSQGSLNDSQTFTVTSNTIQSIFVNNQLRENQKIEMMAPIAYEEEYLRIPAERQFQLLQLGFSYDELRRLLDVFERFKREYRDIIRPQSTTPSQLMHQFSNFISLNPTDDTRMIGMAFNLLELGNPRKEVQMVLLKARRKHKSESDSQMDELEIKRQCLSPSRESTVSPQSVRDHEFDRREIILSMERSPQNDDGTQLIPS